MFTSLLVLVSICGMLVDGRVRTYYIAAVEVDWDYAPLGNCVNNDNETSDQVLLQGPDRVGKLYRKILYREFPNRRFASPKASEPSLGMLGPIIRAETGDTIVIIFKNLVTSVNRSFSVHPHGVQYNKNAEGALYVDKTTGTNKSDDGVAPGQVFSYVWRALPSYAPTDDDDTCLPWAYHSHVAATKDVDSGLVGLMLICKEGTLTDWSDGSSTRKDVSAEYPIYLDTADENDSWLLNYNLQKCRKCKTLFSANDQDFLRSNRMAHVNGFVFGNLPGLDVAIPSAKPAAFYFFSINRGVTSVHFSGQVLTVRRKIVDSVTLFPATFVTGYMYPSPYAGYWLLASRNFDTYTAGQQAYLRTYLRSGFPFGRRRRQASNSTNVDQVVDPELSGLASALVTGRRLRPQTSQEHIRRYYLAIENYVWDYAPSGRDLYGGFLNQNESKAATYLTSGPHRIGRKYKKTRYVQYTDSTFRTRAARVEPEEHLGMLGPVLMAEVDETVRVSVRNLANRAYSFLPHGVHFRKSDEGFVYTDPVSGHMEGRVVEPGETTTYTFKVPALGTDDLPCVTRSYHSAVYPIKDVNTGLLGPLLLCNRGQLNSGAKLPWYLLFPAGRRSSVGWFQAHQHFFLNFFAIDENFSWHLQDNINTFTTDPAGVDVKDPTFISSNRMHAINGRMFGNLEGLKSCIGDNVAWHLFGDGGEFDMHGVNFQGQTLEISGTHVDAKVVIPGTAMTLTSCPDTVGNWSIACRTNFHFDTGMTAKYEVSMCKRTLPPRVLNGVLRHYYIAAQEVLWDYAPLKRDLVTGKNFTDHSLEGYKFVRDDEEFIGSAYKKVRYIEYTDATFTTKKIRTSEEEHLGILGPIIKAEVGDVIEVVFFNNASRSYSIHPQGVQYEKRDEGANYQDGAAQSGGDAVASGETFTYTWRVPERAGPGKNDPKCVAWMYYSSVNSVKDMNSGLIGPLLVCKSNTLSSQTGSWMGMDHEFWMLFFVFDENFSWYLQENARDRARDRAPERYSDPEFVSSNQMFAINGLIYGNVEGLTMNEGDNVAWYLLGLGSTLDYHPVHFHGQTFKHRSDRIHRGDVLEVFPSTSSVVEMECDNPGTWIVHCHFSNHVAGGMEATYTVLPRTKNNSKNMSWSSQ